MSEKVDHLEKIKTLAAGLASPSFIGANLEQMTLETDHLILRDYVHSDWERIHIYAAIPDFSKFELWGPNTDADSQKFVKDMHLQASTLPRFKFDFAVCLRENNLLIGGCGIRRETELSQVANLGWAINPEFQNKGYATEAARALICYGYEQLRLSVIYAKCDTRNLASSKVMEKLGMLNVGTVKGTKEHRGYVRDTSRYELVQK